MCFHFGARGRIVSGFEGGGVGSCVVSVVSVGGVGDAVGVNDGVGVWLGGIGGFKAEGGVGSGGKGA